MFWFDRISIRSATEHIKADIVASACEVYSLFSSHSMIKTAGSAQGQDIFFHIDPKIASKYRINFKLMDENDKEAVLVPVADHKEIQAKTVTGEEFEEITIPFTSKSAAEPNYLCSVVLQKPEGKVYCVSAYVMETYLGRYAFRTDFYFREGSRKAASKCFERVSRTVRELRQEVIDDGIRQDRVPHILRKRLSGTEGEIETKTNKMATYLDPDNVIPSADPTKSFSTYTPTKRSVLEDLNL